MGSVTSSCTSAAANAAPLTPAPPLKNQHHVLRIVFVRHVLQFAVDDTREIFQLRRVCASFKEAIEQFPWNLDFLMRELYDRGNDSGFFTTAGRSKPAIQYQRSLQTGTCLWLLRIAINSCMSWVVSSSAGAGARQVVIDEKLHFLTRRIAGHRQLVSPLEAAVDFGNVHAVEIMVARIRAVAQEEAQRRLREAALDNKNSTHHLLGERIGASLRAALDLAVRKALPDVVQLLLSIYDQSGAASPPIVDANLPIQANSCSTPLYVAVSSGDLRGVATALIRCPRVSLVQPAGVPHDSSPLSVACRTGGFLGLSMCNAMLNVPEAERRRELLAWADEVQEPPPPASDDQKKGSTNNMTPLANAVYWGMLPQLAAIAVAVGEQRMRAQLRTWRRHSDGLSLIELAEKTGNESVAAWLREKYSM